MNTLIKLSQLLLLFLFPLTQATAQFNATGGPIGPYAADALLAEGSDTIFLEANHLAWRSTDGGSSFQLCGPFPNAGGNPDAFARRGNTVFAACNDGDKRVFRSDDLGDTWVNIDQADLPNIFGFSSIIPYHLLLAGDSLYLASTTGLYVHDITGSGWRLLEIPGSTGGFTYDLRGNSDTLFVAQGGAAGGQGFISTDAGANWTQLTAGVPNGTISGFTRLGNRYVAGQETGGTNSLWYSDDEGATWLQSNGGGPSITDFDQVNGRVYASGTLGLWVTEDGANWSQVNELFLSNAASENADGDLLYTSGSGAFRLPGGPTLRSGPQPLPLALSTVAHQQVVGERLFTTVNSIQGFSEAARDLFQLVEGNWAAIPRPSTENFFRYTSLANVNGTLRAGTTRGLWDYNVATNDWTSVPGPQGAGTAYFNYHISPAGEVFRQGARVYYRTAGGNWAEGTLSGGGIFQNWTSVLGHDGALYGFTGGETAYRSDDGGASWSTLALETGISEAVVFNDALVFRENNVFFGEPEPSARLGRSTDGLTTITTFYDGGSIVTISPAFVDDDNLLVFFTDPIGTSPLGRGMYAWADLDGEPMLRDDLSVPVGNTLSHLTRLGGALYAAIPGWSVWVAGEPVSIEAHQVAFPAWSAFPNPTVGRFTLDVPAGTNWWVVDGLGRVVLSGSAKQVDLSGRPKGLYHVIDEWGRARARVILR